MGEKKKRNLNQLLAIVDNNFSMWHRSALTAIAQCTAAEIVTNTGSQLTGKQILRILAKNDYSA